GAAADASAAAAVVAAGTGAGAGAGVDAQTGRVSTDVGAGRVGAELPRRTKPPSPEPAAGRARFNERGVLPNRSSRTPQPLNSGERLGGRNRVFVGVRGGKFGRVAGRGRGTRRERTRPGGRVAGRPPARGRGPMVTARGGGH